MIRLAILEPLPNGVSQIIMRDGIRSLRNQHASQKKLEAAHWEKGRTESAAISPIAIIDLVLNWSPARSLPFNFNLAFSPGPGIYQAI
jgi:hypothetical protein